MVKEISQAQARRFMLRKQGLLGARRFRGPKGLLAYVAQAGCVQYDPVDVCGKSHELAFLARVEGFTHEMLDRLLYERRSLIDYFDKNMCVLRTEDWPYLEPTRSYYRERGRSRAAVDRVSVDIMKELHARGCASSQELHMEGRADWYWSETTLSRAALETLYFRGDLVVHHKRGAVKSYALARDCLPAELLAAENPCKTRRDTRAWQALRRIGAVGMLWNGPSDAWLGIDAFRTEEREAVFRELLERGEIAPVEVEGMKRRLYVQSADLPKLEQLGRPFCGAKGARLLPPLDGMLWDRKLIAALFGFSYKWEIYTPKDQRKYGYYTLPVLYGERFAGRVEPVCERKKKRLTVRRFWPERGFRLTDAFFSALEAAMQELRAFHEMEEVWWEPGWLQRP